MNCEQFEQRVWAEPRCAEPEFARHRAECPECGRLAAEVLAFEDGLERELEVAVPAGLERRIRARRRVQFARDDRAGWLARLFGGAPMWLNAYAAAASVLLVIGALTLLPAQRDFAMPLDRLVTEHYLNEPFATRVDMRYGRNELETLVASLGAELAGELQGVSFAEPCVMERGIKGAHLVLANPHGKVTVLILHHRRADGARTLQIADRSARLVPFGRGAMAVIGPDGAAVTETEARIRSAVRWL